MLSQEPVLNGKIYCSPWCGGKCTKAAHDGAVKRAKALAKRCGPGFKPRVWENLGWHYSAVSANGLLKVHPCGKSFTAYLGDKGAGGRWAIVRPTPRAAIKAVRALVQDDINEIERYLKGSF